VCPIQNRRKPESGAYKETSFYRRVARFQGCQFYESRSPPCANICRFLGVQLLGGGCVYCHKTVRVFLVSFSCPLAHLSYKCGTNSAWRGNVKFHIRQLSSFLQSTFIRLMSTRTSPFSALSSIGSKSTLLGPSQDRAGP
jgi:hypothetical protein